MITTPPRVSVDGLQHYINQGGAELVTFTASGYWNEAGVRVGKYTFRSFPMPGANSENARFALFAYPWDLPRGIEPQVYVRNSAGTEAHGHFWFKLFPKKFRSEEIEAHRPGDEPAGGPDRAQQHGRPAGALPEDQRRDAPRQ